MQSDSVPLNRYATLFHAASIDLVIPEVSGFPPQPSEDVDVWWKEVEALPPRKVAFLDEKLFYLIALSLTNHVLLSNSTGSVSEETPNELLSFLNHLQLTMTASFVPPLPQLETRRPPSLQMSGLNLIEGSTLPGSSLAPPRTPNEPHTPDNEAHLPPVTPNPFPAMAQAEEQYAKAEGVITWEGAPERMDQKDGARTIFQRDDVWKVVWRGEVPLAYVRTAMQNPLLSLTASVTLREQPVYEKTHRKAGPSVDGASIRSGTETVGTDGTATEGDYAEEDDDVAGMEEIDLLGGLAGGNQRMPAARLAPSIRQDLSVQTSSHQSNILPPSDTPFADGIAGPSRLRPNHTSLDIKLSTPTTLRKSYRRILSLSSGLRVRMRTLFLPQLLPIRDAESPFLDGDPGETEGDRRIVLCVEIENPPDAVQVDGFEVEGVEVDVGGKGGKASAELVCQPEQKTGVFPLKLRPVEQYNLLYAVSISSTPDTPNRGDEQRPISITVIGRPYMEERYPTSTFPSRWNCNLDLASFYSSIDTSGPSAIPGQKRNSLIKPTTTPTSVIAGDKRYSLASLNSDRNDSRRPAQPKARAASFRGQPMPHTETTAGLLVSVKVLPQSSQSGNTVRALEPFSIEVFVHNRTESVRRFRLSIPLRDGVGGKVREAWEKRRRRKDDEPSWGVDDFVLRQILPHHLSSSPALIPLENDVRCGPLLPGASLSCRIRFLALRDGVHKLEKLRITSLNDDSDFVMSPALDVVVGQGIDTQ